MLALLAASALLATFILAAAAEVRQRRLRKLLPPGPAPHWLRGNPVPALYSWRNLGDVAHRYGGVAAVWQGRTPLVVVGSVEAAEDLYVAEATRVSTADSHRLEKHAAQTADRPRQVVADEVLSRGHRVLLGPSTCRSRARFDEPAVGETPRLKRMRKSLHAYLQPSAAKRHEASGRAAVRHAADSLSRSKSTSPLDSSATSPSRLHRSWTMSSSTRPRSRSALHVRLSSVATILTRADGLTGRFDITHPFVVNVERNKKCDLGGVCPG